MFEKAWEIVRDTHFDPEFAGLDWDAIRLEYLPRAKAAKSRAEVRPVIDEMLGRLGQSHFAVISSGTYEEMDLDSRANWDLSGEVGFDFRAVNGKLWVTKVHKDGPAEGIVSAGQIIRRIDGWDIELPTLEGFSEARADFEGWVSSLDEVYGPTGSEVVLDLENPDGSLATVTVERARARGELFGFGNLPSLRTYLEYARIERPRTSVGVIHFNYWMIPTAKKFDLAMDELRDTGGIVIDLRGNLGGLAQMLSGVSGHFLADRDTLGTIKSRKQNLVLRANPRFVDTKFEPVDPFSGPVAVLIDAVSYSASEFFAGAMQGLGRVRVFGQPSSGGALTAMMSSLPGGDVLEHAVADFETSSGVRLEGRGVIPDVVVPWDREAMYPDKDPVLEAALSWIEKETQP